MVGTVSDSSPVHTKLHAPCVVLLSTIQPAFRGWVETLVLFSCATNHESSFPFDMTRSFRFPSDCSDSKTTEHTCKLCNLNSDIHGDSIRMGQGGDDVKEAGWRQCEGGGVKERGEDDVKEAGWRLTV